MENTKEVVEEIIKNKLEPSTMTNGENLFDNESGSDEKIKTKCINFPCLIDKLNYLFFWFSMIKTNIINNIFKRK